MKGRARGTPRDPWRGKRRGKPPADLTTCERKYAYMSADLAHASAAQFSDASRRGLVVYRCPECQLWHLGHNRSGGNQ